MEWDEDFVNAKYHLAVAKRMMASYREYPEKRFLVGVINEAARAVSRLVRAFLIYENCRGDWKGVVSKYLDGVTIENLVKILEIEKAQRVSPVEFVKRGKIVLLVDGKYRVLTVDRISEFIGSIGDGIVGFPGNFRQV
jgi:hypothetical protein